MRFVHTSDWQIGKSFRFADDDTLAVLQNERLEAIGRIGLLARTQGARVVLVAGDVWDNPGPSDKTLRQTLERMRRFPDLHWHLIPGNHDPNLPGGLWERLLRLGLPDTVHAHLSPQPVPLEGASDREVWLLPAVLDRRHAFGDPTAGMDEVATPEGALRIGLAHGSVRSFGSDPSAAHNLIAADRATRSGLAHLALGDWHGMVAAGERSWYSGTPEPDGFDRGGDGGGSALLVSLEGAVPVATPHPVGRFVWRRESAMLTGRADIDALEERLRGIDRDDPSRVLAWLIVEGALGLEDHAIFRDRIEDGVGSALRALRIDASRLQPVATPDDLAVLGTAGALRDAADRLAALAGDGSEAASDPDIARAALQRLVYMIAREGASS
ncbi:metallophosphoesterase family protein [Lichenicola sp.]|uniref:metallophosphoesterase family protein n=1 Tax=Lichenicola sp. TaxID=2804529 RepID=UPI003B0037E4